MEVEVITKPCLKCKQPMVRSEGMSDLNWSNKKTCSDVCRQILSQRRRGRGNKREAIYEPTEEQRAEIEERAAECRRVALAGMKRCERGDG